MTNSIKCSGEENEKGEPVCEGEDVRAVEATHDSYDGVLKTNWCAECRLLAEVDGWDIKFPEYKDAT